MNKFIKLILFSIGMSAPFWAHAGGSWVGNSPMLIASAPTTIYPPMYSNSAEAPEEKWNSLLLPDGKSRISIGAYGDLHDDAESVTLNLAYEHAFSANWTTYTFTTWGYNLLAGNGKGSELALFFGLLDGFDYSGYYGLQVGPGVGVGYSYSTDHWRFVSRLNASGLYNLKWGVLENSKLRLLGDIQYFISDNWAVGLQSGLRYYVSENEADVSDCASYSCEHLSGRLFTESTMGYLTRKLSKQSEISVGLGTDRNARVDYSFNW